MKCCTDIYGAQERFTIFGDAKILLAPSKMFIVQSFMNLQKFSLSPAVHTIQKMVNIVIIIPAC